MNHLRQQHLEKLRRLPRKHYHPLIHAIHRKHGIHRKTLFYVKEYGPHSNVPKTIIRESLKVLLFASVLSSLGGLALENVKLLFLSIAPLIILLPTLNDMIGDYGSIVSSKFSAMLHEGKVKKEWWHKSPELRKLFAQILVIAVATAAISAVVAIIASRALDFKEGLAISAKIFAIAVADSLLLVGILFAVAVVAGIHFYKKHEDPNNFLIPITTSVADFGNMIILAVLVSAFF